MQKSNKGLRIRWTWVQDWSSWAFSYFFTWAVCAAIVTHAASCGLAPKADDAADIWGTSLQLLGTGTIVYGINSKLREHADTTLFRNFISTVRSAFAAMPLPLIRLRTISVNAQSGSSITVGGRGRIVVGPAPNVTVEQRLYAIESNYSLLLAAHDELEKRVEEQTKLISKTQAATEAQKLSFAERLKRSAVQGFASEITGVALLTLGAWYGTMPMWTPMACQ